MVVNSGWGGRRGAGEVPVVVEAVLGGPDGGVGLPSFAARPRLWESVIPVPIPEVGGAPEP